MISITVDDHGVQAALHRLNLATADMTPAMANVGNIIETHVLLRFQDSTDPWGKPWQGLSQGAILSRLRRRKGSFKKDGKISAKGQGIAMGGFQPLLDTGRLRGSITTVVAPRGVAVGTNVKYAATHQFGRGGIPARPFLPLRNGRADLPAPLQAEITDTIGNHLMRALGK